MRWTVFQIQCGDSCHLLYFCEWQKNFFFLFMGSSFTDDKQRDQSESNLWNRNKNTFKVWLHTIGRRLSWVELPLSSFAGVLGLFLTVFLRLFLLGCPLTRPSCNIVIFPSLFSTMKDSKMTASTRQVIVFMLCSTRLRRYQQVFPRCFLARSYVEVMYSS